MKNQLSIIIVTHNSERLIFDCLSSIYEYNDLGDKLEVIIVDNCSENCDKMFEQIRSRFDSNITLVKSIVNKGYGHGNNQGVRLVNAKYFIVMNPDIRLVKPVFKKLISKFENNLNIGMIGVGFVDGSNKLYFKPEYSNLLRLVFAKQIIKLGLYKVNQMFFSGSFLMFEKEIFLEAGSFDENIFLFHEEADISNRIQAIGRETYLAKDISVLHLAHGREVNPFLLRVGSESREFYFKKYNANLSKYYKNMLIIYRIKYVISVLLNNKIKKTEFLAWIKMCKNNGVV